MASNRASFRELDELHGTIKMLARAGTAQAATDYYTALVEETNRASVAQDSSVMDAERVGAARSAFVDAARTELRETELEMLRTDD